RTRGLALVPPCRTRRTVATLVGLVHSQNGAPALRQPGQLGTGHGDQRWCVRVVRDVGESVEAFPHGVAENLPENLIHLALTVTFSPIRRLRSVRPEVVRVGWLTAVPSRRVVRRGPLRRSPRTPSRTVRG